MYAQHIYKITKQRDPEHDQQGFLSQHWNKIFAKKKPKAQAQIYFFHYSDGVF